MSEDCRRTFILAFLTAIAVPASLFAEPVRVGRVREGEGKRFLIRTEQTLEHYVSVSTNPVARENWTLNCESDSGKIDDTHCVLKRIYFDPCSARDGRGTKLEAFELDSRRGNLRFGKVDLSTGVVQFGLSDIGGDGVYGMNSISATLRLKTDEQGVIHLIGIGGRGSFKSCQSDDYHDVVLLPPLKDSWDSMRIRIPAGPREGVP